MNKHICKNIYSYQDISRTDKHCSFIGHWQGSALPPRYAHVSAEATSHGGRQRRSWWLQGFQLQPDPAPVWPNLFWRSNPLGFVCNIGYIMVYLESIYILYIYIRILNLQSNYWLSSCSFISAIIWWLLKMTVVQSFSSTHPCGQTPRFSAFGTAAVALLWFSCLWVSSSDVSSKTCSQLRFGTDFFRRESRLSQLHMESYSLI